MNKYLQAMLDRVSSTYDKLAGGFFYDLLFPSSVELERIDADNLAMLDRGFFDTATGEDLDRKAGEVALTRKNATYANTILHFTGPSDTLIPAGTIAASENAEYRTSVDAFIVDGYADIPAVCVIAGRSGNAAADTINKTALSGIDVTNPAAVTDGADPETDDELRERCYFELRHPPGSGNPYDYIRWAMEVTGCRAAKCIPLWAGNGTVKVIIIGQDGNAAQHLIDDVAENIKTKRPVGPMVTVVAATPVAINVSVTLEYSDGFTVEDMQEAATEAIAGYLDEVAFLAMPISYAKIGAALLDITGVRDHTNLTVNGGIANVAIAEDEIAVIGGVIVDA